MTCQRKTKSFVVVILANIMQIGLCMAFKTADHLFHCHQYMGKRVTLFPWRHLRHSFRFSSMWLLSQAHDWLNSSRVCVCRLNMRFSSPLDLMCSLSIPLLFLIQTSVTACAVPRGPLLSVVTHVTHQCGRRGDIQRRAGFIPCRWRTSTVSSHSLLEFMPPSPGRTDSHRRRPDRIPTPSLPAPLTSPNPQSSKDLRLFARRGVKLYACEGGNDDDRESPTSDWIFFDRRGGESPPLVVLPLVLGTNAHM